MKVPCHIFRKKILRLPTQPRNKGVEKSVEMRSGPGDRDHAYLHHQRRHFGVLEWTASAERLCHPPGPGCYAYYANSQWAESEERPGLDVGALPPARSPTSTTRAAARDKQHGRESSTKKNKKKKINSIRSPHLPDRLPPNFARHASTEKRPATTHIVILSTIIIIQQQVASERNPPSSQLQFARGNVLGNPVSSSRHLYGRPLSMVATRADHAARHRHKAAHLIGSAGRNGEIRRSIN
jgi:hypothetical protein